jgi:glycosyltransferase involved in cell wall biosynthesis
MTVAILTQCALAPTDGTGAQLLLMFLNRPDVDFIHFYLTHEYGGVSKVPRSYRLDNHRYTGRGKHKLMPVLGWLGLHWWKGAELAKGKFASLRKRHDLKPDVAYVFVTDEATSAKFNAILAELNVPYVAHSMDLYHDAGLDPATMPETAKLLRGAAKTLAISEPIGQEIAKFGVTPSVLPFGKEPIEPSASAPVAGQPFKILIAGRPYLGGLKLLADAWPALKQRFPNLRIVATGGQTRVIPEVLRPDTDDRGFVADDHAYHALLADCHVGFLSGPNELDRFGRFSIPSRSGDFLMAGLPIIGVVPTGSATEIFMRPLTPQTARFVTTTAEMAAALAALSDPATWTAASEHGRAFAQRELAMDRVRGKILSVLKLAADGGVSGRP